MKVTFLNGLTRLRPDVKLETYVRILPLRRKSWKAGSPRPAYPVLFIPKAMPPTVTWSRWSKSSEARGLRRHSAR